MNVEELRVHLLDFLAMADPDVLAEMMPLEHAQALLILSKAASILVSSPLGPITTLNYQAATSFIGHSLPDLNTAQKKRIRDISRGESRSRFTENRSAQKKHKYPSSEKQSIQSTAQEFLEKATRELLGTNNSDMKRPLRIETSDEEDQQLG